MSKPKFDLIQANLRIERATALLDSMKISGNTIEQLDEVRALLNDVRGYLYKAESRQITDGVIDRTIK